MLLLFMLAKISKRLVKNEILPNLNFIDMNVCMDCIIGKQTNHTKEGSHKKYLAF